MSIFTSIFVYSLARPFKLGCPSPKTVLKLTEIDLLLIYNVFGGSGPLYILILQTWGQVSQMIQITNFTY